MRTQSVSLDNPAGSSSETGSPLKKKWRDVFTSACYVLVGIVILTLFVENFIFSSHFGLLNFRGIDDIAFQDVLRKVHLLIFNGDYTKLWEINDYAYGWIFWAPMALITYPLYLLSTYSITDWPLIVAPRQVSLMFAVLSLIFLRKILKRINVPEWGCAAALLIFSLYPTFGYFSLRFGTVNAVMFFSLLSLYLAQRDDPSTLKGRMLIALVLATAGGIKLSGLLIVPLVFLFVIFRLRKIGPIQAIRGAIIPALLFVITLVIFTNPALLTLPLDPKVGLDYWQILNHFLEVTKIISGPANPFERFYSGVVGSEINGIVILALSFGLLIYNLKEKKAMLEPLAVFLTLILIAIYLIITVNNASSAGSYFTAVSFLFLFGVAGWASTRFGFTILLVILILQLVDSGVRARNQLLAQSAQWNHWNYFIKSIKTKGDIENATNVAKCMVGANNELPGHIFIDFTATTSVNTLTYPKTCVSVAWNNLSPLGKYCSRPVDYLVLDKMAIGALPIIEFNEKLHAADAKTAEGYLRDRESRINLVTSGDFGDQRFKPVCEYGRVQVFKAVE